MSRRTRLRAAVVLTALGAGRLLAQGMAGGGVTPGSIWPSQGEYAGSSKCALCHAEQSRTFHSSSMSRALEPIATCEILTQNPHLSWSDGPYRYSIDSAGGSVRYTVTDGSRTAEAKLLYAFGQGKAGQTYVYAKSGQYYESRVSYYKELKGLALTVGAQNLRPSTIEEALGRLTTPGEARDCFGCHTTGARRGNQLQLESFENGVQCEDCHGPGRAHVEGMEAGKPLPGAIRSLKGLKAEETNDLCGACHRTWETVMLLKIRGTSNVRFQPYRLTNSPCFISGDSRIACTACHNPHQAPATDPKAYDSKCAACHSGANSTVTRKMCKVSADRCITCHMPKYEVPGSHHAFADHWIRVARAGEPYPD